MNLLLTGATGVLGSELLRSLVEADDASLIYVLLRAAGPMELAARAAELCAHLDGADAVRVVPIAGDVTADGLGLGPGFATLAAQIDEIYHAAACTRFDAPADVTHAHNVVGTRRVLEFARAARHSGRSGRLHYVSTAYVSGRRAGWITEDEGDCGQEFFNGYEWSKFEAEREVRTADLPVTIYRPGILVGHSRTGWVSRFHGIYQVLRWIDRGYVRALPCRDDVHLDLAPADYAAGAIVRLAATPSSIGRTFHLTAGLGNTLPIGQLISMLCAERRGRGETGRTPRFDDTLRAAGNRRLDPYMPYLTCPKIFDNEHTRVALRDFPVPSCRVFFPRIIRYAIEQEFRPGSSGHRDDDLTSRVSLFEMTNRVGGLTERVASVDDGRHLARLDQFPQDHQVVCPDRRHEERDSPAHEPGRHEHLEQVRQSVNPAAAGPDADRHDGPRARQDPTPLE
jgi:thioester reductase-like protein